MRCKLLAAAWLGTGLLLAGGTRAAETEDLDAQLAQRHALVFAEFQTAYRAVVEKVNQRFGIDYAKLDEAYHAWCEEYQRRLSAIEAVPDEARRQREKRALEASLASEALQYLEAKLYLDNELDRDHLLKARRLQGCEEILDMLTARDPLLRRFFHSPDYQRRYGLLLTRMVWALAEGASAWTKPLDTYTMFTDRTRMPFLITVSPTAFTSLAFLRSILLHEITHVLLCKGTLLAGLERPSSLKDSIPTQPTPSRYSLLFTLRYGHTPSYQYHLLQEYYAFSAQLLYDELAPPNAQRRLSPADRAQIERLRDWTYGELSDRHKAFVTAHPDSPIVSYIRASAQSGSSMSAVAPAVAGDVIE